MSNFRIQIFSETSSKDISFGSRTFNEVGRDILGIKIALGLIAVSEEDQQLMAQNSGTPAPPVPFDDQGWFDCATGHPADMLSASTFDKSLESALMKYQLDNQFLIICYLFEKYGVKNIIGKNRRVKGEVTGENWRSQGSEQVATYDPDSEKTEYSSSILRQIESALVLFDEEFSTLGEATLAVLHGWRPHSSFYNTGYAHSAATYPDRVVDIIPEVTYKDLVTNKYSQTLQDLIDSDYAFEGEFKMGPNEEVLKEYKERTDADTSWIADFAPLGLDFVGAQFSYGYIIYKPVYAGQHRSLLFNAASKVLAFPEYEDASGALLPPDERRQRLQRIFYPDPFTNPAPFFIGTHEIGYFYETDFELSRENLPTSDNLTIQQLEESALMDVLSYYNKPDLWWYDIEDEFFSIPYFQGEAVPTADHLGEVYPPFEALSVENKMKNPEYERIQRTLESYREILKTARDLISGDHNSPWSTLVTSYASNLFGIEVYPVDYTNPYTARDTAKLAIKQLETDLLLLDFKDIKSKNYWIISTNSTIRELGSSSPPTAQSWRELEESSPTAPLIEFQEYITPSLRPGARYRAFFKINKEKLDMIQDANGDRLLNNQQSAYVLNSEAPEPEADAVCTPPDRESSMRTYQEYRAHAVKKRREISRKFKDAAQQASMSGSRGQNVDLGQFGPWDMNSAFPTLTSLNGASSDYAYTQAVASSLAGSTGLGESGPTWWGESLASDNIAATQALASPQATTSENKKIKQSPMKITMTHGEFKKRISVACADLDKAGKILKKEGYKFAPGSNFVAQKEVSELKKFSSQLTEQIKLAFQKENAGQATMRLYSSGPSARALVLNDKATIQFTFRRLIGEPLASIGPKVGLMISSIIVKDQSGVVIHPLTMMQFDYDRPRTQYYINQLIKMTSGTISGRPPLISPQLGGPEIAVSYFDKGRKSCLDLGVNMDNGLALTLIKSFTSGLKIKKKKKASFKEAFKDFTDEAFVDPAKEWAEKSKKNWEDSFDSPFDEDAALRSLGKLCTRKQIYKEFYEKLDLAAMICDYLKCIKLPGFEMKLPSFHLPVLPKIPILGFYKHLLENLQDLFEEAIARLLCTLARTIIDKLAIPFCEDQLQEFIAAGSSATPLMNEALAASLTNTGLADGKETESKKFFEDASKMLTGQELCHLLSGRPLDGPTMMMLNRLADHAGVGMDLDSEESITNFFGVIGVYLPSNVCEELSKYSGLPSVATCTDTTDLLRAIRARLGCDPDSVCDPEIQEVLDMAEKNMQNTMSALAEFSDSDIGSALPDFFNMSNAESSLAGPLPDFIAEDLQNAAGSLFASAKSSYISALGGYVNSMNVPTLKTPKAGDPDYNWRDQLELEAATANLEEYTREMERINSRGQYAGLSTDQLTDAKTELQAEKFDLTIANAQRTAILAQKEQRIEELVGMTTVEEFNQWGNISLNRSYVSKIVNNIRQWDPRDISEWYQQRSSPRNPNERYSAKDLRANELESYYTSTSPIVLGGGSYFDQPLGLALIGPSRGLYERAGNIGTGDHPADRFLLKQTGRLTYRASDLPTGRAARRAARRFPGALIPDAEPAANLAQDNLDEIQTTNNYLLGYQDEHRTWPQLGGGITVNHRVTGGEDQFLTLEIFNAWAEDWNSRLRELHELRLFMGDWKKYNYTQYGTGYLKTWNRTGVQLPSPAQLQAWQPDRDREWLSDFGSEAGEMRALNLEAEQRLSVIESNLQSIEYRQSGTPMITRGAVFRLFHLYHIEQVPGTKHWVHKKYKIPAPSSPGEDPPRVYYENTLGYNQGTMNTVRDLPNMEGRPRPSSISYGEQINLLMDPKDQTEFGLYARVSYRHYDSWGDNRWWWALSDKRLFPYTPEPHNLLCPDDDFFEITEDLQRILDGIDAITATRRWKTVKSEQIEFVTSKAIHSIPGQNPPGRLAAEDLTQPGPEGRNEDAYERAQGFLYAIAGERMQFLSNKINEIMERRRNTFVGEHLPMVKDLLSSTEESTREWMSRNSELDLGALGSVEIFGDNADEMVNYGGSLKLGIEAGVFSPHLEMSEIPGGQNTDKYEVKIKGDYFLRQQGSEIPHVFSDCVSLPDIYNQDYDNASEYPKRNKFANLYTSRIAEDLDIETPLLGRDKVQNRLYKTTTENVMEDVLYSLYDSDMFDDDYARQLDARVAGKTIITKECKSNRYSLEASSILSFDKVIIQNPVTEVMKEYAKPSNNPVNRDIDDPEPFALAIQAIGLKGYIRACLIDLLLKGGISYATWDIEPILGDKIFIDYAYNHCRKELEASDLIKDNWKSIIQRSSGMTSHAEALKSIVREEMLKLPSYSKQIFNPGEKIKDYYNWYFQEKVQNMDISHDRDSVSGNNYWKLSEPIFTKDGKRSFIIEHYVRFSGPMAAIANIHNRDGSWSGSLFNAGHYEQLIPVSEFNTLLTAVHNSHGQRDDFRTMIEDSNIHHGVRLVHVSWKDSSVEHDFATIGTLPHIRQQVQNARILGTSNRLKSYWMSWSGTSDDQPENSLDLAFCVPLAKFERPINYDSCPNVFEIVMRPNDGIQLTAQMTGIEEAYPVTEESQIVTDVFGRPELEFTRTRSSHLGDLGSHMVENLLKEREAELLFDHIFPVRRFMTVSSIFTTSVLAGYNDLPRLMDSTKSMISLVIFAAINSSLDLGMDPGEFQKQIKEKFPGDPDDPACFDFPGISGDFFKKFWEDLKKLIIMMPSILLRGIANQLDPAYKEMRTHYLNCDIKDLTMSNIRWETVDDPLTNGLYFPKRIPGTCEPVGNNPNGKKIGEYAPIFPTALIDYYMSYTNPWALPRRLAKTALKTVTYVYNGNAPFLDPSFLFKIPCLGIDENFLKGEKYDAGMYGRYGHPLSPFTLLALSTYQLDSDIEKQKGNCEQLPEDC